MLEKLLLVLNDCAWAYDVDKKDYLFISPAIEAVLGLTADALKADHDLWHKIIVADERKEILHATQNLKNDEQVELHYRVKLNGAKKWMFEKKSRFTDPNTGHNVIFGVIKDVSDQKTVDYHLKNTLGDFSVLFDKSISPMWIYETPSLRILKVNDAAISHYGYSREEFLQLTIRDLRPKIDLAKFNKYIFKKGITEGKLHGFNNGGIWKHINKSGELLYAEITGYEMRYNNTSCRVIIATDVTKRIMFEEARDSQPELNDGENLIHGII